MNPLAQPQNNQNSTNLKQIKELYNMAKNPNNAVLGLLQNNPQIKNIMNMCAGRNPKDVFYEQCQAQGINPQDILNLLK